MARLSRFPILVTLQLCIPVVICVGVGLYNGHAMDLGRLLPNYLYMATPHLLVSLLTIRPSARRPALLWVLTLLNLLLIAFQLWIFLAVPARESGIAWVLYIPLWGLALLACAVAWAVIRYRGRRQSRGSG